MDIIDLQIFYQLYTLQNITKVSETLNLSQPAVSYRLKKIQDEFNSSLYEYNNGYQFSKTGEQVFQFCEKTLHEYSDLKKNIAKPNSVGIALSSVAKNLYLNTIFDYVIKQNLYPSIHISSSKECLIQMINGTVDCAVIGGFHEELPKTIAYSIINQEKVFYVYHKDSAGNPFKDTLIIDELSSGLHQHILKYLESQFSNTKLNIIAEIGHSDEKLRLVNAHRAASFIPETYLDESSKHYPHVRISDTYYFSRYHYLLYPALKQHQQFFKNLIKIFY